MSRAARPRTLPIDSAVQALGELHTLDWSWTTVDLGAAMKAAGLTLREPVDDMTIPFEHPRLPGVDGYVTTIIGRTTVVDVSVTLAEDGDENDADFRTAVEELYAECHDRLSNQYGVPVERPRQRGADWPWDDDLLQLRDLGITVVLTLAHEPAAVAETVGDHLAEDDASPTTVKSAWNALAYELGQLLDGLADLDFATFAVGGTTVLTISRDGSDVWVLATGPEDEVEPIELSHRQLEILRNAHFAPPLAEEAERSGQKASWWFRVPLPADEAVFDTAGNRMVSALRDVYGAKRPEDVIWQGLALSDGTQSVLDTMPLTRSPYQRS